MKDWHVYINNQDWGPYHENILRELIGRGQLTADTYVYNDSPEEAPKGWQRAADTEIVALFLNNSQGTQTLPSINQNNQKERFQVTDQSQDDPGKGLNIASLVLGIISLFMMFWALGIGIIPAIVGLPLGVIGKGKSREAGAPTGMATAGIVCSIVALGINIAVTVICIGCFGAAIGGGISGIRGCVSGCVSDLGKIH